MLLSGVQKEVNFHWLLKHNEVTDFKVRQNLVLMMFQLNEMLIDWSRLLAESFEDIGLADASALHGMLFKEFENDVATGSSVLRE